MCVPALGCLTQQEVLGGTPCNQVSISGPSPSGAWAEMCGARRGVPSLSSGLGSWPPVFGPTAPHCLAAESCSCCCAGRLSSLARWVLTCL